LSAVDWADAAVATPTLDARKVRRETNMEAIISPPPVYHDYMTARSTAAEIETWLAESPGWSLENGKLHKEYVFADFVHAFGFMATAAVAIEKANHHPEWANVYNRVTVDLTTHDAGGVSAKDFTLARLLDSIAQKLQ
jgi:4a-hydroxytetrahydrobiopterin dehydratase